MSDKCSYEGPSLAVLGLGHIGLPTAVGFVDLGWRVFCADEDAFRVERLRSGKAGFSEPGLDDLLVRGLTSGRLNLCNSLDEAIRAATILFICVGTPQKDTGEADLSQVQAAARSIARNLNGYKLIVVKSTVPAGTTQWVKKIVTQLSNHADAPGGLCAEFDVASNPEFLQEGRALRNIFHPDRVVLGVETERARVLMEGLYHSLDCPLLFTNLTTAELTKQAANAFLSTKVSFINLVADLCDAVGADVAQLAQAIGLDPRIGRDFLNAGIGFGGYCLPKDLRAFTHLARECEVDCRLLDEVENINLRRKEVFLKKVRRAVGALPGKKICILGLAFKGGTDDIRESPAMPIVDALLREGACLQIHDPKAIENSRVELPPQTGRLEYFNSAYDAARKAHALLILADWPEYRELNLSRLHEFLEVPVIIDGRNLLDPDVVRAAGFDYLDMGRNANSEHRDAALEVESQQDVRNVGSYPDTGQSRRTTSSFACDGAAVDP